MAENLCISTLLSIFDQFRFSFVFLELPKSALIAVRKTPAGSIFFNSWLRCYRKVQCLGSHQQ